MPKTTVFIDDNNYLLLKQYIIKKKVTVPVTQRTVLNNALDLYFNDITNKELLAEIKKLK